MNFVRPTQYNIFTGWRGLKYNLPLYFILLFLAFHDFINLRYFIVSLSRIRIEHNRLPSHAFLRGFIHTTLQCLGLYCLVFTFIPTLMCIGMIKLFFFSIGFRNNYNIASVQCMTIFLPDICFYVGI